MAQRQKLTAVHDISGAWNGIGAGISALWQQTKVTSSPSALVLVFIYLSCVSGLHIISSSVIQFEAFNNTVTSVVPSSLAWTSSSVNLSTLNWNAVGPLMAMSTLLPTAKGLSESTLFDVPLSDYAYTGAVVDATTISAECGLLSNLSVSALNSTDGRYYVNISGLGEVGFPVQVDVNMVWFMDFTISSPGTSSCSMCNNNAIYQVTTPIGLGNQTGEVFQLDVEGPTLSLTGEPLNVSTTSHFVACTLNATTTSLYLSMQDGKITNIESLPNNSKEAEPWAVWSSGDTTELTQELTQMFNNAEATTSVIACQGLQFPAGAVECASMSHPDRYINSMLGIPWVPIGQTITTTPASPITLEKNNMQNAIAQTAAAFVWLAGAVGVDYGGFLQDQGERSISYDVLVFRLNVNITPVVVGLIASCMLLATVVWMFHHSQPTHSKTSASSPNILGLIWISAHSIGLQAFMKSGNSLPDQLRLKGMKAEVCLADMKSEPIRVLGSTSYLQMDAKVHAPSGQVLEGQFFMHWLCYGLHAILLAFHVVLVLLLMKHPEHNVTMASDNPWVTTALTIFLQAFYVLYTAGLVFITQQLATSAIIAQRHCLTEVHDISQAWTGIGAAIYALWQQIKVASSTWTLLGVVSYLACVSTLQTASTTIMQFTAFNSYSTILVQSAVAWPNATTLANVPWGNTFYEGLPPSGLLSNIQTIGLLNNTLYDILTTTDPSFTNATVNATSLQSNCGLLSNLTFSNLGPQYLNFSDGGIGPGYFVLNISDIEGFGPSVPTQVTRNQIVLLSIHPDPSLNSTHLFFLITTNVEWNGSIPESVINLSVNIATDDNDPIMAYLAACTLSTQSTNATLNLQAGTLIPSPAQASSQPWKLWAPGIEEYPELSYLANTILSSSAFGVCPQNGYTACSLKNNASLSAANSSLYSLTPNQLQQAIEDSVAAIIWTAGQLGSNQGGFDRTTGESQVTQVITKWRLNINTVPIAFASTASLILVILVLCLIRIPSRLPQHGRSITGLSVLEILWVAANSQTLCENMVDLNDPSLDDLRRVGMFKVCLGNIGGFQSDEAERETFLE
ncbi:hypothetical protein J3R82DRAFT_9062 [Butyriboletus roseoflavus]|nr:hypothetical protein J3R82DRAFT_9062 [Butyriboletus roseoflavus]